MLYKYKRWQPSGLFSYKSEKPVLQVSHRRPLTLALQWQRPTIRSPVGSGSQMPPSSEPRGSHLHAETQLYQVRFILASNYNFLKKKIGTSDKLCDLSQFGSAITRNLRCTKDVVQRGKQASTKYYLVQLSYRYKILDRVHKWANKLKQ